MSEQSEPRAHAADARTRIGRAALAMLWAVAVAAVYYVRHKPMSGGQAGELGLAGLDLVLAGGILVSAIGLGRRIGAFQDLEPGPRVAVEMGLGLGAISLLWLGLAGLGLAVNWVAWLILGALLLASATDLTGLAADFKAAAARLKPDGGFQTLVVLSIALLAGSALVEALAPPAHFDALVYHLALPQRFIQEGGMVFTPENPFWGQPLAVEMLYMWAMMLRGPETGAVLGWAVGVITLLGVAGLAGRIHAAAPPVAVGALLAGETLYASLGWAYVDWWAGLFGLGAFALVARWVEQGGRRSLVLAGALAGFAVGAKYTAGVVLLGGWVTLTLRRGRLEWRDWVAFGGTGALLVAPWLAKNLLTTGDPLYPFLSAADSLAGYRTTLYTLPPAPRAALMAPWIPIAATLFGVEGAPGFAASIGPLLIALTPGALLPSVRRHPTVRRAWVFFLVAWAAWAVASLTSVLLSQSRLYLAVFPIWSLLAAAGYAAVSAVRVGEVRLGKLAQTLVLLVVGLAALRAVTVTAANRGLATALGAQSDGAYLTGRLGAYAPALERAEALGSERNVLMLWEARGLYCPTACVADAWLDRWRLDLRRHGGPESVLRAWSEEGIDYLLLHRAGVRFLRQHDSSYDPEHWRALEALLDQVSLVETIGDGYELYRLVP